MLIRQNPDQLLMGAWFVAVAAELIPPQQGLTGPFCARSRGERRCHCASRIRPLSRATGDKFCQRATKQPISHRGSWGAQTGPGTFRRQLISIIMNYNQPWTTLGLAPQPQRENCDPNGSQGSANFHCIMYPGSPWSALRSLLRLQSAILTSTSDARDFVGGPEHR